MPGTYSNFLLSLDRDCDRDQTACRSTIGVHGVVETINNNVEAPYPRHRILKSVFGFDAFRPGQEAVIDALLQAGTC